MEQTSPSVRVCLWEFSLSPTALDASCPGYRWVVVSVDNGMVLLCIKVTWDHRSIVGRAEWWSPQLPLPLNLLTRNFCLLTGWGWGPLVSQNMQMWLPWRCQHFVVSRCHPLRLHARWVYPFLGISDTQVVSAKTSLSSCKLNAWVALFQDCSELSG